jgi:hypothetical protein
MDGINCGCVIHDTKLGPAYPLAMFYPMELRASYLGADTRSGLGVLIGTALAQNTADDELAEAAKTVATSLGFDPAQLPAEPPVDLLPRMPPGWKLAMTADGLGVAADATLFAPDQDFALDLEAIEGEDLEVYLEPAVAAMDGGYYATALWHLRNGYTFHAAEEKPEPALVDAMSAAYESLQRPYLVESLTRMVELQT